MTAADDLVRVAELLVRQVGHWTPARWRRPLGPTGGSRADAVHSLVQRLADLAAEAEGGPRRLVPRVDNDLALVDQFRVVTADLAAAAGRSAPGRSAAGESAVRAAVADIAEVRSRLD